MSGPRDDFLDALTFQVKEEVINRYLRERIILEEEVKEYDGELEKYEAICNETREHRDSLVCLLAGRENFRAFFKLLGFDNPPLKRFEYGTAADQAPACPIWLMPRGFTKRGRYVKMVRDMYSLLYKKAEEGRKAAEDILKLADEINDDIKKFHLNHDIMAVINFLKSMDVEMRLKKRILGANFTAAELGSIEEKMLILKLRPMDKDIRAWPNLPEPEAAARKTEAFVLDIFERERERIVPALQK